MEKQLVSVSWLRENINNPNLVILDATIPTVSENCADFTPINILGARFFDIKNIFSDSDASLPNTMPTPQQFEKGCINLGIHTNSIIIIYDAKGIYSSPRVWFMFKTMGHDMVAVLDGGLPEWIKQRGSCTAAYARNYPPGNFKSEFNPTRLKKAEDIVANINTHNYLIIDARSEERFLGMVSEPRTYLKRGHIPKSINLPYTKVLKDGKLLPTKELSKTFKALPIGNLPLLFSCGSGITACIPLFAVSLVLSNQVFLYDGSWTEWGNGEKYPIT